jgi:hypothetical protein
MKITKTEHRAEAILNLALGGLNMLCILAAHPDASDELLRHGWDTWLYTWTQTLGKDMGLGTRQITAIMDELLEKLSMTTEPKLVLTYE